MNYIGVIKDGVSIVNHCWQLVIIHLLSAIVSFISFFLIVGIPISIAFVMFGIDLTEILRLKDMMDVLRSSLGLLKKYFAMALVILTSLLIYFTLIFALWLFTIAGSAGTLGKIINSEISKYSSRVFFGEGKRLFFHVFGFSAIIGTILMILAFLLGMLGGGISSIIEIAKSQEAVLALFLGIFFSAIIFITGLFLILIILSLTVYGVANIVFNRISPLSAFRETVIYLYNNPSSIGFYGILLIGSIMMIFLVLLLGTPIIMIPFFGPILSPLYQIASTLIQGYINLIMLASAFVYYYKTGYTPPPVVVEDIPVQARDISGDSDTSLKSADEPAQSPQKTEENQQK